MKDQLTWTSAAVAVILLLSCSQEQKVTFEGNDRSLTYSCNSIEHKAEDDKDLELLARHTRKAVKKLHKSGQQEQAEKIGKKIKTALSERDRRRFEELAVEAKCSTKTE